MRRLTEVVPDLRSRILMQLLAALAWPCRIRFPSLDQIVSKPESIPGE